MNGTGKHIENIFHLILFGSFIPRKRLKSKEELAPHMRRFAKLIGKIHSLDKVTYADLKLNIDPTYAPKVSFEEAKKYVLKGLSILGDDYLSIIKDAFDNHWIDYAESLGKRTGALCSRYFVEAPSTTNELLLANHLLDVAGDDLRMRRWVLSQMISRTYYHNFVTHFIEAYYQREVYRLVDTGKGLDAERLNALFRQTLEKFWGVG